MRNKLGNWFSQKGFVDRYRHLLMVLLLNLPIIFLVLLMNLKNVDATFLTWVYIPSVIIGYYILPLLLVVTILWLLFFSLKRLLFVSAGAVVTVFVFYLVIDYFTYVIAKIHIDLFWLEWILNDFDAFGLTASTIRNVIFLLLGLIVLEIVIFKIAGKIRKPRFMILAFTVLSILAFGLSQTIHMIAYQRNYSPVTSLTPYFPVYVPITSHKNATKYGELLPIFEDEEAESAPEGTKGSLNYPIREIRCNLSPDKQPPNIVIIYLESWRFDMMNDSVTPNIYALSQKSTVCQNHFCSGNSTVAGVIGLFYGIHPTYWTAIKANSLLIDNPVFIDILKENNYRFGIFAKSHFERHKVKDAIFRGIEIHNSFAGNSAVEQDADMTGQLISFVREQSEKGQPYMTFCFYKANHFPYQYPKEDSVFLPAEDMNLMFARDDSDPTYYRNDYMNSTRYVDKLIGKIINELDSLGELANTIVIISTDHSDELNDNRANYWGHGSNFTKYQIMVPMVLYLPGHEPQQLEYATSHIDIVPTILPEYFGCTNDIRDYSNGKNLFEKPDGLRPFVIGSYVNHAFVIEDNVYEIFPMYTRKYKLDNINEKASSPPPQILKVIMDEINCFYKEDDSDKSNEKRAVVP